MSNQDHKGDFRQKLTELFNLSELKVLCHDLGITYENLSGDTREEKAVELIDHAKRHGKAKALLDALEKARREVDWRQLAKKEGTFNEGGDSKDESISDEGEELRSDEGDLTAETAPSEEPSTEEAENSAGDVDTLPSFEDFTPEEENGHWIFLTPIGAIYNWGYLSSNFLIILFLTILAVLTNFFNLFASLFSECGEQKIFTIAAFFLGILILLGSYIDPLKERYEAKNPHPRKDRIVLIILSILATLILGILSNRTCSSIDIPLKPTPTPALETIIPPIATNFEPIATVISTSTSTLTRPITPTPVTITTLPPTSTLSVTLTVTSTSTVTPALFTPTSTPTSSHTPNANLTPRPCVTITPQTPPISVTPSTTPTKTPTPKPNPTCTPTPIPTATHTPLPQPTDTPPPSNTSPPPRATSTWTPAPP